MEYYAIVVSERYDKTVLFNLFPKIDLEYYNEVNLDNINLEELQSKKNHYLEVKRIHLYEHIVFDRPSFSKNQWFHINISEKNGRGNAKFYENIINNETNNMHIDAINLIDGRTREGRKFRGIFDLNKFNSTKPLNIIEELAQRNHSHLAVYNVGQGNCNALCEVNGKPQIYFDLGGGYAGHSLTYPPNLHLCECDNPLIILSHWDGDHWKTSRVNPNFECMTWIVPQQKKLSADAFNTFLKISVKGKILIYPKQYHAISSKNLTLIQCTGKSINDSGLALEVKIQVDEDINRFALALLPGDAKYKYISTTSCEFKYLIVTHHGGKNPTIIPNPISNSNCHVYSYGHPNTYGHPEPKTILDHTVKNWSNRKNTENGHIALGVQDLITCNNHVQNSSNTCNAIISQVYR